MIVSLIQLPRIHGVIPFQLKSAECPPMLQLSLSWDKNVASTEDLEVCCTVLLAELSPCQLHESKQYQR